MTGKTLSSIQDTLLLCFNLPGAKVLFLAPYHHIAEYNLRLMLEEAKNFTYLEVEAVLRDEIRFTNGSKVIFRTPNPPERLLGFHETSRVYTDFWL